MLSRFATKTKKNPLISVIALRGEVKSSLEERLNLGLDQVSSSSAALAVLVDSPGGSPAVSHNIYKRLKCFHDKTGVKIYTFAEDVAASGGYFIISAGNEVYANKASIVGSIGAISMRFDPRGLATKVGILPTEVISPGSYNLEAFKVWSDPTEEGEKVQQEIIDDIYKRFVQHVEDSREDKLKGTFEERQKEIYNSDVFLPERALELG